MKKIIVIALMIMMASMGIAADAIAPATNPWTPVVGDFLQMLIQILSPILVALASYAAWAIAKKFGVDKEDAINKMLQKFVEEGIHWADAWAKKQSEKPTGDAKKAEAVRYILDLVKGSSIPGLAEDKLKERIEAILEAKKKTEIASGVING